jgi:hypothetical protein
VFAIPMTWFEGELVICLIYLYPFAVLFHFLHVNFASPIILARILMIMLVTMLR